MTFAKIEPSLKMEGFLLIQNRVPTLSDALIPRTGVIRDIYLIVGFAIFTTLAAQISFEPPSWYDTFFASIGLPIAGTPVPITLQTLAVAITGATLGSKRGILSMAVYMAAGVIGLPVYAGAIAQVLSPDMTFGLTNGSVWGDKPFWAWGSFGYILGFVVASYAIGWLTERGWDRTIPRTAIAILIGSVIIYLCGLPWLMVTLGVSWSQTLSWGLWPFVAGDTLKLLIATGILPSAWFIVRRRD